MSKDYVLYMSGDGKGGGFVKLSARGHYGLIAMTYLAQQAHQEPVSIKTIAAAEHIPESFLEQIFHTLRKAGLVKSVRGSRGGFQLARPADQLTAGEIVRALEGPITPVECLESDAPHDSCAKIGSCATKIVWERLQDIMVAFLDSITLRDIVERDAKLLRTEWENVPFYDMTEIQRDRV